MAGKSWRQDLEVFGHVAFIVSKESDGCSCSARFLLFIQSEIPAHGTVLPIFKMGLSILINLI